MGKIRYVDVFIVLWKDGSGYERGCNMNALTKAISRSRSIRDTAYDSALRVKTEGGAFADLGSPMPGGLSDFQDRAKHRNRYELYMGWLYSAIHALSSKAASQPFHVARRGKAPPTKGTGTLSREKAAFLKSRMTKGICSKAADHELEILTDHPLVKILENPNPIQDRWQFVYDFVANLNLTGWSYTVAAEDEENLELAALPTTWVTPIHKPSAYSSFKVINPAAVGKEPVVMERDRVAFAYLPDPSNPLGAKAPTSAQLSAVRIDDRIQTSQEMFFENGIFPSVIITLGKQPIGNVPGGVRPKLSQEQWRQITSMIDRRHKGWHHYGNPVILDGLVEKVDRWSATQTEMGWEKSEEKIRMRLLSAFGVHPHILGEHVSIGGHAQAAIIKELFFDRVNIFLDMLSNVLTNFLGTYYQDENLLVWWEPLVAIDRSLRQKALSEGRKNGDISQNEWRAEYNFPPDEDNNQAVTHPGIASAVNGVLSMLGQGQLRPEQAQATLESYGIPSDQAEAMAGVGLEEIEREQQGQEQLEGAVGELSTSNELLRLAMSPPKLAKALMECAGCHD